MRDNNDQISSNYQVRAKFKQRIAGGAVLLIVLAVFLPFIFNHSHLGATTEAPAPADNYASASVDGAMAPPVAQQDATALTSPVGDPLAGADAPVSSEQPGLIPSPDESAAAATAVTAELQPAQTAATSAAQPVANQPIPPATVDQMSQPVVAATVTTSPAAIAAVPAATANKIAQPVVAKTKPAPPADHTVHHVNTTPVPAGRWLLQVGSFTQAEYAAQLSKQLRARGLNAYTQREPNHFIRVYVGPLASKQQAQEIQSQIQRQMQLNSLIIEKHV